MIKKTVAFFILALLLSSCASKKKFVYLINGEMPANSAVQFETTLQPDDNLIITVTADEPALANDFNLLYLIAKSNESGQLVGNEMLFSYLVDQKGDIDFPILGKIHLSGLTRIEAEAKLKDLLKGELANPVVNLRVINFKVSVEGEVARPGQQSVIGDRITIFEALSTAGGMTVYGKRNNVLVIREKDGLKNIIHVDLTKADIINSPYYYLAHNDVIYVEPNQTKVNSSVIGPNLTVGISAISLIVTIIALSTRN